MCITYNHLPQNTLMAPSMFKNNTTSFYVEVWSLPIFSAYFPSYTLTKWICHHLLDIVLAFAHDIPLHRMPLLLSSPIEILSSLSSSHRCLLPYVSFPDLTVWSISVPWDPTAFCVSVTDPFSLTCYLSASKVFLSKLMTPATLCLKVELFEYMSVSLLNYNPEGRRCLSFLLNIQILSTDSDPL